MKVLRWIGIGVGGLVGVVVLVALGVYAYGGWRLNRSFSVEPASVVIPTDLAAVERGRYLAAGVGVCITCHGENLAGQWMVNDPQLGYVRTPNLTPGQNGIGRSYTDADWVRAIRHGVGPSGKGIVFMPTDYYFHLTDDDLGALIAYLKALPPVDTEPARTQFTFPSQALIGSGAFGEVMRAALIDHTGPRPATPSDRGHYLAIATGCSFCHGQTFGGGQGPEPGAPPGPALTRAGHLRTWSDADFISTMRTGVTPYGKPINPLFMPWHGYRHMSDEDLLAIWRYLQSIPVAGQ
jgi:mono/diheme cytochrome c family protein